MDINLVDLELILSSNKNQRELKYENLKAFAIYKDNTKKDVSDKITIEIKEGYEVKLKVQNGSIVFVEDAKDYDEAIVVVKYEENSEIIRENIVMVNVPQEENKEDNSNKDENNNEENNGDNNGGNNGEAITMGIMEITTEGIMERTTITKKN